MRNDVPTGSLRKTYSILSWVACSKRPLRAVELLDGIALSHEPYELSSVSKLSTAELGRCIPLIEVDHSGFVNFVHFSAKEYIRHSYLIQPC
jgi:hypothetical protein